MNTVGNIFSGQVVGETAKTLSERFGKVLQKRQSISILSLIHISLSCCPCSLRSDDVAYLFGKLPDATPFQQWWNSFDLEIVDMDGVRIDKILVTHDQVSES